MTHDSCIFIGRACLRESSESVRRKSESSRESERYKEEEKSVVVCEVKCIR